MTSTRDRPPVERPVSGEPGKVPPLPPPTLLRQRALRWLPWIALVVIGISVVAVVQLGTGTEPQQTPVLAEIDPYQNPEVFTAINLTGHVLGAPTFADLDPYESPEVIAAANLPGHVLEAITLGEISPYENPEVFTALNTPAHVLEMVSFGEIDPHDSPEILRIP